MTERIMNAVNINSSGHRKNRDHKVSIPIAGISFLYIHKAVRNFSLLKSNLEELVEEKLLDNW